MADLHLGKMSILNVNLPDILQEAKPPPKNGFVWSQSVVEHFRVIFWQRMYEVVKHGGRFSVNSRTLPLQAENAFTE